MKFKLFFLFLFLLLFNYINSLRISNYIQTQDSWHIVTRFCFKKDSNNNQIVYSLSDVNIPNLNNIFLFETSVKPEDILELPLNCMDKANLAYTYSNHKDEYPINPYPLDLEIDEVKCFYIVIGNCDTGYIIIY